MLKYKDGEKTIVVPSDAIVVNLIPGDKADLVPGAKIFIPRWAKAADGTWEEQRCSWAVTASPHQCRLDVSID